MTTAPRPIPFRADPAAARRAGFNTLIRSVVAHALSVLDKGAFGNPDDFARQLWAGDRDVELMTRNARAASFSERVVNKAAVDVTSTINTPSLMQVNVADLIVLMGPVAGAELLSRTLRLTFDRNNSVSVPAFLADASNASFVKEGAPVPIFALLLTALALEANKLATGTVLTREMLTGSPLNVQAIIEDALKRCLALALDAALFDANPAIADLRPAGLRNGIAAKTASVVTNATDAMIADVSTLAGSVAPVAGNEPIVMIADPVRAMKLKLRAPRDLPLIVLGSSALSATDLIAIAPSAVVSVMGSVEVGVSTEAAIHANTVPTNIGVAGTPNTIAVPTLSLFQTDCVCLLPRLQVSWARRDDRAVAWLTTSAW